MEFKDYISKHIDNLGLSLRDVVTKLEEYDIHVSPSYISQLKNGKAKPPNEKMCSALAKVLNVPESVMFIESYLSNAPDELKKYLLYQYLQRSNDESLLENKLSADKIDSLLIEESLGDFIHSSTTSKSSDVIEDISFAFIDNDSFEPLFPQHTKILLSDKNKCGSEFDFDSAIAGNYDDDYVALSYYDPSGDYRLQIGQFKSHVFYSEYEENIENSGILVDRFIDKYIYFVPFRLNISNSIIHRIEYDTFHLSHLDESKKSYRFLGFVKGFESF